MTTPIETQCPHCKACFSVEQTQLNKVNAIAKCDHCKKHFLVNQHLIVTPEIPHTTQTKVTATNSTLPLASKKHAKDLSSDDLIYDDMDIDEPAESIVEYDSLDSMDAWLSQASQTVRQPANKLSKATNNKNNRSSITSSISMATSTPLLSSVAANDIHASIDNSTENSWLEELLKEQNKQKDKAELSPIHSLSTPLQNTSRFSKVPTIKPQAPEKFAVTLERQSIASILWTLGCLVLASLLFAQYVIFNLDNLVKNPAHAERLQAICSIAVCSLPSAELNAFTIASINHKSSQVETTGTFSDISALLNNQSEKAQLYPNIKVSVYDANDLIGEFIAEPKDYLLSKQSQLAANSSRRLLFTVPVANAKIREVVISPLY